MKGFQKVELVKFVGKHVKLLFGTQYDGNITKDRLWEEITLILNSIGSNKTAEEWKKSFIALKASTKKKVGRFNCQSCPVRWSNIELQIIEMFDWVLPVGLIITTVQPENSVQQVHARNATISEPFAGVNSNKVLVSRKLNI